MALTLQQFGATVKKKHPEYNDMTDEEVGQRVLKKYPQYQDMVETGSTQPAPAPQAPQPTEQPKQEGSWLGNQIANTSILGIPLGAAADVGKSTVKSVATGVINAAKFGKDALDSTIGKFIGKSQKQTDAEQQMYDTSINAINNTDLLKAKNIPQGLSDALGTGISYALPSTLVSKVTKLLPAATTFGRLLQAGTEIAGQAGLAAVTSNDGDRKTNAIAAGAITGGLQALGGLGAIVKKLTTSLDEGTRNYIGAAIEKDATAGATILNYIDDAASSAKSGRGLTPEGRAGTVVESVIKKIETAANTAGSEVGNLKKLSQSKEVSTDITRQGYDFYNRLVDMGVNVKGGKVVPVKGVVSSLDKSDISYLNEVVSKWQTFMEYPTFENGFNLVKGMRNSLNYQKAGLFGRVPALEGLFDSTAGTLSKALQDEGGVEFGKAFKKFAYMKDVESKILQQVGNDNQRATTFLSKILKRNNQNIAELVDEINKLTGVNLEDHAQFAELATTLFGSESQKKAWDQLKGLISSQGTVGKIGQVLNAIGDTVNNPRSEIDKLTRGVRPRNIIEPLRNPVLNPAQQVTNMDR